MFQSLHTSSSAVHIKSTVNIQIIKGLLQCYSIVKNAFKNFYLITFIAIKTNLMNKTKLFTSTIKNTVNISKTTFLKTSKMEYNSKTNETKENRANNGKVKWTK